MVGRFSRQEDVAARELEDRFNGHDLVGRFKCAAVVSRLVSRFSNSDLKGVPPRIFGGW